MRSFPVDLTFTKISLSNSLLSTSMFKLLSWIVFFPSSSLGPTIISFLSAFILDAYAFSTEGIVGYSIGKKNKILFTNIVKNSFILSSLTGILISLFYLFFKNSFIDFMTDIENVRDISYQYSFWLVLLPFVSSFCYQLDGIFIGASQTKDLRNGMMISVASFVVISIYLTKYFNNHGLWLSLLLFMILRSLTLNIFFKKILRKF